MIRCPIIETGRRGNSEKGIIMTQISDQVEAHFHKTFRHFDSYYSQNKNFLSRLIDSRFRRSMQLRFQKVIEGVSPYSRKTVLDIGCGTGRYCFALASKGIERALGIDFAQNMILEAQRLALEFQFSHICQFIQGDFLTLPIEEPFHHVFAVGVLDYIDQPVPFVKKMIESGKESVMISFPSKGGFVQKCRKFLFQKIKKCPVFFYTQEDINRIAREAGATHFTIEPLAQDYFLTIQCHR